MANLAELLTGVLKLVNQVLSATVVLTSFSLLVYLLTHNFRSRVARAFGALLAFVLIVYAGDVVLYAVETQEAATRWLKFQWIGIAFVPAAYLQFSAAVLHSTNLRARWLSAVVLLVMALFHLLYMHIAMGMDAVSFQLIAWRWQFPGWRLFDLCLLVFGWLHGANGMRIVLDDYVHSSFWRTVAHTLLLVVTATLIALGVFVILTFKTS
jgi:succinate dehydrogenase / fumarate reductase membrane anchor subunit